MLKLLETTSLAGVPILPVSSLTGDGIAELRVAIGESISGANEGALPDALQSVHDAMVTNGRRYSPPMLVDQLQYLYFNIQGADQRPSGDMQARFDELAAELHGHLQTIAANATD